MGKLRRKEIKPGFSSDLVMQRTYEYLLTADTFNMSEVEVITEIRRLLDEQMKLLEHTLTPDDVITYLTRQNKIGELLKSLSSDDSFAN